MLELYSLIEGERAVGYSGFLIEGRNKKLSKEISNLYQKDVTKFIKGVLNKHKEYTKQFS